MSATANIPEPQAISVELPRVSVAAEFRSRMGSISRHSTVYFAGTILTAIAGYFFKIYLARRLGAEALGIYALGISIIGFLGLFNAAGLPAAATRYVAQYHSRLEFARLGTFLRRSLGVLSAGNLVLGAVVLALGPWIAVHFYRAPSLSPYFWFFVPIMFIGVLNTFLGRAMAGYQEVARRTLITHFVGSPANILIAVVLISLGFGLSGYLAAQVASACLILLLLGISVWKLTPVEARSLPTVGRVEKEVIAFSAVAFALTAIEFVLGQADKIVLGYYLHPRQVGIYAVAMGVVGFVPVALQSVNQIFSPTIAELYANGNQVLLQQLYATLTKWILVATLPLALAIITLSRPLISLFGPAFHAGAVVLIIGTAGQLINCGVGSVGYLLLMSGKQMQLMKIQGGNAALMIVLSVLLVPRLGIAGAATASAISVISTNLFCLAAVVRGLKLFPYNSGYSKLLPPAMVSTAVLVGLLHLSGGPHSAWIVLSIGLISSYAVFLCTLLLLGLNADDRRVVGMFCSKIGIRLAEDGVS